MGTLTDKIVAAFKKIGTTNGTAPKPESGERDLAAHELLTALSLATLAEARKKKAKTAAVKLGIITDAEQRPSLEQVEFAETDSYRIFAKTANGREMIDPDALMKLLIDEIGAAKAASILSAAKKTSKAATSWIVTPKADA
jgi:hypothetical protein